ncbi:bifunctional metallophosphatase/5'-nucleotidase [Halorarius halobius]|uniref:bifunctional metallophosphatase/5'-nucleotidase n=1 Tax=Halorarius halobius TaxID=2962671 RepID=UPI0020CEA56E|nr:bifunctional metallophosphatase/5'-nucleotidase [Halorarius halobius]
MVDDSYVGDWRRLDGGPAPNGAADLTLAHLTDLHGQLTPSHQVYYDNPQSRPDIEFEGDRTVRPVRGLATHVAKLSQLQQDSDGDLLTLVSGDTFHGTAETTYTNGKILLEPLNEHVQPDVYVPGNWDFGHEAVKDGSARELMDAVDAPTLACNLRDSDGELLYDGTICFERGGVTIGIVGMTNVYVDRMAPAFHAGKYRFDKDPTLLDEAARNLRDQGADFVVALTEIGLPWMVQAAKDFESIDLMLSAHTHEYTHAPIVIEETDTVVVESGMGEALGRVDLRFDTEGIAFRHLLYCFVDDHEYTPDPDSDTRETIERLRAPFFDDDPGYERGDATLDRPLDTVVGETARPLFRQSFLESAWNTLFNDALRAHFDADLAVAHGFRYGQAIPSGEITLGDLYTFFPMTAPVAVGDAWGQQLRSHMEDYLIDNFTPHVYGQEDGRVRSYSSNVECVLDPTAKRGRRLVEMRVDGEPVAPDETYRVATFRRPGDPERDLGGCGFPFRDVRVENETIPVDVVEAYLEDNSPVEYDVMGLIETVGKGAQNTPADGPYPYIQPGVDYASGTRYVETSMVPRRYDHPNNRPIENRE